MQFQIPDKVECLAAFIGFAHKDYRKPYPGMIRRLFKGKSAAPAFSICELEDSNSCFAMSRWSSVLVGDGYSINGKKIAGGWCNTSRASGPEEPEGCVATLQSVVMTQHGMMVGYIYHRNKSGPDYIEDPVTGEIHLASDFLHSHAEESPAD